MRAADAGRPGHGPRQGAITELTRLALRVNGCGGPADGDDWIVLCASQLQIRSPIELLASTS